MTWLLALALVAPTDEDGERKRRIEDMLGPAPADSAPLERPEPLRLREPWVASTLGGVVGFGTGHYYAGNPRRGFVMSGIDLALSASTLALAARDDRGDGTQSALAALATGLVISRLYQAVVSYLDAGETNRSLKSYSFVPLGTSEGE